MLLSSLVAVLLFSEFQTRVGSFPKNGYTTDYAVSQYKQHHMKVLFSSFPKNGHTTYIWFDLQTKKLEPHCITIQTAAHESTIQ